MLELSRAHEEHIRDLRRSCRVGRDALPYTDEFASLKEAFWERSFKQLSDAEFWQAILTVAKKGGIRGKRRVRAPLLTDDQKGTLRGMLPVPVGERDRLPYTEMFDRLLGRFNRATGSGLDSRELWRAVANLAK